MNKRDFEGKQRFSIRKLTIGACSVLLSTLLWTATEEQVVHADTVNGNETEEVETGDSTKTTSSSDSTQTDSDNKQENNVTSFTVVQNSDATNSNASAAEVNTSSETTSDNDAKAANTTSSNQGSSKDNASTGAKDTQSAKNSTIYDETKNQTDASSTESTANNSKSASDAANTPAAQKSDLKANTVTTENMPVSTKEKSVNVEDSKVATTTNDIKPIGFTANDDKATVSKDYQLTDADAARFIKNASALEKAGAKITWESTPDTTNGQATANGNIASSGNVVVTYKDGTKVTVPVSFYLDSHVALNQLSKRGGYNYYYVDNVGDNVTSMDTADDNGNVLFDPNDQSNSKHSLISVNNSLGYRSPQDYKFSLTEPLDTSTQGIHWATVNVDVSNVSTTGDFGNILGNYTIKVPYIVKGLNLKKGIPTDSNGNPVINAQLASDGTNKTLGFDLTARGMDTSTLGQYFYQDYDLAYALGVKTTISDYTKPTDLVNTKTNSFKMILTGLGKQTAQTVNVNYVKLTLDDLYYFTQGTSLDYRRDNAKNMAYFRNLFSGTNDIGNKLGKVTVNGQTYTSSQITHQQGNGWLNAIGSGNGKLKLNVTFDSQNSSGQPVIFSNNLFCIIYNSNGTAAGSSDFVTNANKWTSDLYVTQKTGNALKLTNSTATTYTGATVNAIALYPSEKTTDIDVDITNNKFSINDALAQLVKNPAATSITGNYWHSQQLPNGKWPEGTTFSFVSDDGQTPIKAGQTYTGRIIVTLPTGTQAVVEQITFHTKASPLVQDKTVYKGTTLTAKDLVTNADVFPDGTTFQFANNSEPNWNIPGTYNAQITATYPSTGNGAQTSVTTDPATAKVTVSNSMQFTITYWDDTDNKQLQKFDMNETQPGYDLNMHFTFNAGNYQSVGVTGVPDGVRFTASFGKSFTDPDAAYTTPNYYWDNAADKLFGANITIHLKHKIQTVNDDRLSQSERTATVKYVNGSTGQSMGNLAPDVQITTYYKRTVQQDLATGQYIYGAWQVDTSKGKQHGYNTDSNAVTISNGTVSVAVPTVAGYTPSQSGNVVIGENGALPATTTITYTANPQQFTIHYVDDDEKGKSVSNQVVAGVTGQTLNDFVKIPENYQLAKGQTEPTSYTFLASNNKDITIHLAHKIQETTEYQTRTATVKYVNAQTGQSMGDLAPDAQLQIYYQRTVTKDMVTGDVLKTGVWQWDKDKNDDGYTNGYHVISGNWTTPTSWGSVSVEVPTVNGFKAFTTGDWEKNKDGSPSTVAANTFVFPAWNGSNGNITDPAKAAIAYTDDAPLYEGTATHVVYYAPDKQETRTITEHYKKYDNVQLVDADIVENADGTKQSYAQAQIHITQSATQFATNGSTDPSKWTIIYGPWGWNQTVGNPNYRGLTIISGGSTIDGKKDGQGLWNPDVTWNTQAGAMKWTGAWRINTPDIAGYTKVNLKGDISRTSDIWGNPTNGPTNEYTTNTGDWLFRSDLTTIYVPKSDLTKTITRTVNIQDPTTGTTRQVPQTVTFSRAARLNDNDDGVAFGALIDNNFYKFKAGDNLWNHPAGQENASGTWAALSSTDIVKPGYTAFINGKAVTEVPAVTVTPDMTDTTVNVTYVKNAAIITISGQEQSKTYDGQSAEITDAIASEISHQISGDSQLTLPDGSKVTLTKDDFSFAGIEGNILSGNPSSVGTYHIVLNSNGLQKIENLDKNFTWSYDPKTSFVTYTINPAQAGSVVFNATANKTYDGSNILNGTSFSTKPSIVIESTDGKPLEGVQGYNFQTGDFEFVDSKGNVIQATVGANGQVTGPTNVGTYTVRLTQAGLKNIENANPNINFSNIQLANTGSGTLTINAYAPTLNLSGNGSKTYDGKIVSSAELTKSDENNNITITFTVPKQGGGTTTVTYTFNPEMDYTGDYDWYSNGKQIDAPKNAGTYTIKFKADQVKSIFNDLLSKDTNYSYLKGNIDTDKLQVSGEATYTINKKPLKVYLTGGSGMTYTGGGATMPLTDLIKHLTADGLVEGETLGTFTFDDADFQWYVKNTDGTYSVFNGTDIQGHSVQTPINVGTYYIGILPETSTNSGIDTLQRDNTNYDVTIDYSKYYQFDITKAQGAISFTGNQTDTYNGESHTINGYTLSISGAGLQQGGQNVVLNKGDLEFNVNGQWTTTAPVNAGTYQVRLSQTALDNLTKNYPNLTWTSSEITSTASDYVVNPTQVTVSFTGGPSHSTYNGSALNVEYTKDFFQGRFATNGVVAGQSLTWPEINSGLFEWVDANGNVMTSAPTNAGTYTLKVKDLNDLNQKNPNYTFVFAKDADGKDQNGWTWVIDKATATITFTNGSQATPWTGQATVLDPANFGVTITTNNSQTLNSDALTVDDFQFYNQAGEAIAIPNEVGNYTIKLNAAGLAKIEKDTANYDWTNNASGNYEITKANATIKLDGNSSMTYNGQAASFPTNTDGSLNGYTVTLSNGQIYTLKPGDLEFSTMITGTDGKTSVEVTNAPVNAGTYIVTLSQKGLANINKVDGDHYQYTLSSNTATFTIKKADATIALNGSGKHTYDGQAAKTSEGNYTIQLPGQSTDTNVDAKDLVFVDSLGKQIVAPVNAGTYNIALSGDYKQQLIKDYGNNYNLTFTKGTFTVDPKVVDLILNGTASQVYNGQPAKVTDASKVTLTWGDHTTTTAPGGVQFTLTSDDLEVVDAQGNVPTKANVADQETNPYYIKLKDSILAGLNSQNKNYTFKIGDTYARYTIYAKESNVALTGEQDANYGDNPMPTIDPNKFTLTWTDTAGTNHTIQLAATDLTIEIPEGANTNNGMPVNAGQYVVRLKQGVIDKLNKENPDYNLSNDPHTNAWYVVKHRQVSFTINGTPSSTYNGQAVQLQDGNYSISFGKVSGNQNSGVLNDTDQKAFNNIKWDAGDFEFVNGTPTNAGTYQVRLSSAGLKKLQDFANTNAIGKNYDFSSVVTVNNGNFTASSVTANYTINPVQLNISLTNKKGQVPSSIIGGNYNLNAGDYTLTITPVSPVYGEDGKPQSFTYNLQNDDVFYAKGLPSNVGSYSVQLTADALQKIEKQFGTTNYTYNSTTSASRNITKGNAVITVSGGQTEYYTGKTAVLKHRKYTVTVSTDFFSTGVSLNKDDMAKIVFYTKNADGSYTKLSGRPTNAGTYYVGLSDDMVDVLESSTGNDGNNYNWKQEYATYVIKAVNRTAIGNFSNSSDYNGNPIASQTITVTTKYPGAKNTTYTLQKGDYEYTDASGNVVANPTDAGTYTIKLTDAGKAHINQLGNVVDTKGNITTTNVNWNIQFNGSYTINQIRMTVTVDGTQNETYNGTAKTINIGGQNGINVTLSVPNKPNLSVPSIPTTGENALTAADFTIKDDKGNVITNPTNAGHYKVYLNTSGLAKLGKLSPNFTVPDSLDQAGTLDIARQELKAPITEGSTGKTFDAQSAALTKEQFDQYKQAIIKAGYKADGLTIDGIDWWFDDTVDYGTQGGMANPIKDIGVYNLRLNAKGQQEIDADNPNYKIKVGDFQYHIYPEVVHIELDNTNSQPANWTNQPVPVNPTYFVPKFVVYGGPDGTDPITNPVRDDGQPLTLPKGVQLEPDDYEFVDSQGNVIKSFTRADGTTSTNPFKVGTYNVRLTEAGWKKLAIQSTDNVHYQYSGTGTLNIKQITPDINIIGGNWKTYDGQPVSYSELTSIDPSTKKPLISVAITSDGHTITLPLNDGDYVWSANGQTLDGAPTNVGVYAVTLDKDKVMANLKNWIAAHPDYAGAMNILANNIGGSAVFEIRAHDIKDIVADPASGEKKYDGTAANISLSTLADSIHATDNAGHVWKLNTSSLTLAKDYTVTDQNGKVVTDFPINVGTYTFKLNDQGIKDLAEANPDFTIPKVITGYSYTYTINHAEATAKLSGEAGKTYDGKQATTAEINAGTSTVSVSINANKTIVYTLQNGDYDWYDQKGNKLDSVPTDVGTYTIKLNDANVLAHLREKIAADPEWTVKDGDQTINNVLLDAKNLSGSASFNITQKEITMTVNGGQTLPDATVHPQNFSVSGTGVDGNPITISGLTAGDFQLVDASGNVVTNPESGSYQIVLTPDAQATIQKKYPNYKFSFSSSAIMNVQSKLTVQFLDTDENGKVAKSVDFVQMGGATIPLQLNIPAGYELANGQTLPTSYDLTKAVNQSLTINLKHRKVVITPTSPSTDIPTGPIPGDPGHYFAQMKNLTANPTRTINVTGLDGKMIQNVESVSFTRTATFDMVTGEITYSDWARQGDKSNWDAFNIPQHEGYTTLINDKATTKTSVAANDQVSADTTSQTINITYAANNQSMKITYQDAEDNVIKTDTVSGKTDQTVNVDSTIPTGWKLSEGQQAAPSEIEFGPDGHENITIIIEHGKTQVLHTDPLAEDAKTPTGKLINGAHDSDLNQTITRVINVTMPNGDKSITTQTAHIYRNATYDDVTGDVTYGDWSTDADDWKEIPTSLPGYTASETVPAVVVKDGQKNVTVDITYTANQQTGKISYQDSTGKEISSTPLSGKTDEDVAVNPQLPAGWKIIDGQDIPKTVKAGANGIPTVVVKIEHKIIKVDPGQPVPTDGKTNSGAVIDGAHASDLNQTITRTINVTTPDGKTTTSTQVAHISRDATYDDVTGEVKYDKWSTDSDDWKAVPVTNYDGYTTHISQTVAGKTTDINSIDAVTVEDGQKDVTITITYTRNGGNNNNNGGNVTPPEPGPTDPQQPTTPKNPTPPTEPAKPTTPAKPGKKTTPAKPSKPGKPGKHDENKSNKNKKTNKPDNKKQTKKTNSESNNAPKGDGLNRNRKGRRYSENAPVNAELNAGQNSSARPLPNSMAIGPKGSALNHTASVIRGGKTNVQGKNKNELPQTGSTHEGPLAWLGSLFAGLGLFGLAADRKRKKKDDK